MTTMRDCSAHFKHRNFQLDLTQVPFKVLNSVFFNYQRTNILSAYGVIIVRKVVTNKKKVLRLTKHIKSTYSRVKKANKQANVISTVAKHQTHHVAKK